jgi:hypothetical protein
VPSAQDFRAVFRFLNGSGIQYVVVGGIAAGLQGEPRATLDVDIVTFLPKHDLERLIKSFTRNKVRLSPATIRRKASRDTFFRLFLARTQIDFIVGASGFEFDVLTRRKWRTLFGVRIPIASPEDLILMKLVAGRPRDWQDALSIRIRHGSRLDMGHLRAWARRLKVQRGRGFVLPRLNKLLALNRPSGDRSNRRQR